MTNTLTANLLEATRLTNAGRLTEATAALQRMLGGCHTVPGMASATTTSAARGAPPTLDGVAEPPGTAPEQVAPSAKRMPFGRAAGMGPAMPEALRGLLDQVSHNGL